MNGPSRDPAKRPRCKTCVYFDPIEVSEEDGWCHRYPPNVINDYEEGMWPKVPDWDWCGEHQNFAAWAFGASPPGCAECNGPLPHDGGSRPNVCACCDRPVCRGCRSEFHYRTRGPSAMPSVFVSVCHRCRPVYRAILADVDPRNLDYFDMGLIERCREATAQGSANSGPGEPDADRREPNANFQE